MKVLMKLSPRFWFSPLWRSSHVHSSSHTTVLRTALRRLLALALAVLLPPVSCGELFAQQEAPPPQWGQPQPDYSQQIQSDEAGYPQQTYQPENAYPQRENGQVVQPLDPERIEQLVAPIALYPDSLVALVLTASTYPTEVVEADRWLQAQGYASAEQIAAGANAQNWDPSVKALTAFPQVLAQMDRNLPWTTDLGNAYYNQPTVTLQAVQVMRQRAQAAGNLQPTVYEAVNYVGGNIQLAPANPQIIYVPVYNPWAAYGQPVSPYPGFSLIAALGSVGSFVGSGVIRFGPGIAMTAFTTMPWGLLAWGLSWLLQAVLFHNSNYCSRSSTVADWGFPYGGPRAFSRVYGGVANSYRGFNGGYGSAVGSAFVHRPPNSYRYPGVGYNSARGQPFVHRPPGATAAFVHRPPSSYSGYRTAQAPVRGYQGFGYAHAPQPYQRPSAVNRPSYDRGLSARLERPNFGQRSSARYGGGFGGYSVKQERSSGFHPFGGGHGSESFHPPKMKAPKSSGGHSGGGHSGGHSGGKHHF